MTPDFDTLTILAGQMGLPVSDAQIRRLMATPIGQTRAAFASPDLWRFYRIATGQDPLPTTPEAPTETVAPIMQPTPTPAEIPSLSTIVTALSAELSGRYRLSPIGLAALTELPAEQLARDIQLMAGMDNATTALNSTTTWMLGDLVCAYAAALGEDPDISELVDPAGRAYNTIANAWKVCEAFPYAERDPNLYFSHYRELYYSKGLSPDHKSRILEVAKARSLSVRETKKLAKAVRSADDPEEAVSDLEESMDAVTTALHMPRTYNYYRFDVVGAAWRKLSDQEAPNAIPGDIRCPSSADTFNGTTWVAIQIQQTTPQDNG